MFQGFTQETVDFLWGIRFNNEKSWFEAHKEQYRKQLLLPMQALAREVHEAFSGRHDGFGLHSRVARIYRDARRLHGQGPYKDSLWFSMERRDEQWQDAPVFWFELSPEGYSYGLGYYAARAVTMAKHRARIDRDPKVLTGLVKALGPRSPFALEGAEYRKPKGDPGPLLYPWYQKKSFSLICSRPVEEALFSPALAARLVQDYELLAPFYRYFDSLRSDPDPRDGG